MREPEEVIEGHGHRGQVTTTQMTRQSEDLLGVGTEGVSASWYDISRSWQQSEAAQRGGLASSGRGGARPLTQTVLQLGAGATLELES